MRTAIPRYLFISISCLILFSPLKAQEDNPTTIGGYGNAFYKYDANASASNINFERFVLFFGHTFKGGISLMSEVELEDAKVSGGEPGGEVALEQAYLKFDFDADRYLVAGLFTPRIGILNENHLPNSFNGNERTQVERYIIPATWRELGVGYYCNSLPLNYTVAVVNGLNSASFEHGSVIRGGRYEGREAAANSLALTGAVQLASGAVTSQVSGYYGGTVGLSSRDADSLNLSGGLFGTPVFVGEANVQFNMDGFTGRVLGAYVSIPKAEDINNAYGNNTPEAAFGAYAEVAYNLLHGSSSPATRQLLLFARYETLDMNATIPSNGIMDGTLRQHHVVTGVTYLPIANVAIKADVRFAATGEENPLIPVNADPSALPYESANTLITLGFGFSF